jgi:hypothetical protein
LLVIDTLPDTFPAAVGAKVTANAVLAPAFNVTGVLNPLREKAAPTTDALEMATGTPPVLVRVIVCGALPPTNTLPKETFAGLADSWPWAPVPLRGIRAGESGALLTMERVPEVLPAARGAKVTFKAAFCPGFRVAGRLNPLTEKPALDADAAEIVRAPVPVLLNVTGCEELESTAMLPKLRLAGLTASCGCGDAPVPSKETTRDGSDAVLVTVTLPLSVPDAVGVKVTESEADCPPAKVTGKDIPLTANALPMDVIWDMEIFEFPVFFKVTVWLGWSPISTLPKASVEGLAVSVAPASPVPERVMVIGEPGALLTKVMPPITFPSAFGAN